jgi:superfamily I DNA/RNA helicase
VITHIASTFTAALTCLQAQEQKAAKLTAIDLLVDPMGKGMSMHRVDQSRDPNFWTVRVNRDLRIVLHRNGDSQLIAYVGHHDDAYAWAQRRRIEVHPRTGAAQFVELVERAEPAPLQALSNRMAQAAPRRMFAALSDDDLLDVGVPPDWLQPVREKGEDELFELLEKLPEEAAEALLSYAADGMLTKPEPVAAEDPFAHPDATRRFRTLENVEELKAALEFPWEKWAVFLHPAQRALVERDWSGPARVAGTAGTGKTVVALHRAVQLARDNPDAKVLLTTFSKQLADLLIAKRDVLMEAAPQLRDGVQVQALDQTAHELHKAQFGPATMANGNQIRAYIQEALKSALGGGLSREFLFEEWEELVDAWNVEDADSYADLPRLGRKTRLGPRQREAAWAVFEYVRNRLDERKLTTWPQLYARLAAWLEQGEKLPFSHIVVDEAQDLSVAQAKFLAAAAAQLPNGLFFAGDLGQRIFHLPFSWLRLGLDVRGRSHRLKVNYRTSHQIRHAADRLLPASIVDLDGEEEGRRGTVSVFDGPEPDLLLANGEGAECEAVAKFIGARRREGIAPSEIALLVRGQGQLGRARAALEKAGENPSDPQGVAVRTMHDAKGLEFRAVAVMACDEDVLPDPARLADIGDMADLEAAYETERHLLYVACTRARDHLFVTGVAPGSEFLADLGLACDASR